MRKWFFTSESVMEGHPDKVCDQIADGILDAILERDPQSRVACDVSASRGLIMIYGQITTSAIVDIPKITRDIIRDIGYTDADFGIDCEKCAVLTGIDNQSLDISLGVSESFEYKQGSGDEFDLVGAGDQGLMFGFACNETPELMPFPLTFAHLLAKKISELRKNKALRYLRPDGKTQVTVEYLGDRPVRIEAVVIACQHDESVNVDHIRVDMIEKVIKVVLPKDMLDENTKYYVNNTGRFVIGGPEGDSGWVGKKLMVDTYGGYARHGGGSFSGKDPTKVDRSGTYAARYVAKNIVAAGLADKCEVQISYAIGSANTLSLMVDTFGTGKISDSEIEDLIRANFDLRPSAIIDYFDLRRPIYRQLACYGHFGRPDLDLPWERTDKVRSLKNYFSLTKEN